MIISLFLDFAKIAVSVWIVGIHLDCLPVALLSFVFFVQTIQIQPNGGNYTGIVRIHVKSLLMMFEGFFKLFLLLQYVAKIEVQL
jgi:uncharacterized protein YqhQ